MCCQFFCFFAPLPPNWILTKVFRLQFEFFGGNLYLCRMSHSVAWSHDNAICLTQTQRKLRGLISELDPVLNEAFLSTFKLTVSWQILWTFGTLADTDMFSCKDSLLAESFVIPLMTLLAWIFLFGFSDLQLSLQYFTRYSQLILTSTPIPS